MMRLGTMSMGIVLIFTVGLGVAGLGAPSAARAQASHPTRVNIVQLAVSQIGTVRDAKDAKGFKHGWEALRGYFQSALRTKWLSPAFRWGIKTVGKHVAQASDWSGHFAIWAVREGGVKTAFWGRTGQTWGPQGLQRRKNRQNVVPGDLVAIRDYSSATTSIRYGIVERASAESVRTIEGNLRGQTIGRKLRHISQIANVWETVKSSPRRRLQRGTTHSATDKRRRPWRRGHCDAGYSEHRTRSGKTVCCAPGTTAHHVSRTYIECRGSTTYRQEHVCPAGQNPFQAANREWFCCPKGTRGVPYGTDRIACQK